MIVAIGKPLAQRFQYDRAEPGKGGGDKNDPHSPLIGIERSQPDVLAGLARTGPLRKANLDLYSGFRYAKA